MRKNAPPMLNTSTRVYHQLGGSGTLELVLRLLYIPTYHIFDGIVYYYSPGVPQSQVHSINVIARFLIDIVTLQQQLVPALSSTTKNEKSRLMMSHS